MNNPFKKILHHYEVPEGLKEKVLNDINMIKQTMDIADLFMVQFPNTVTSFNGGGNYFKEEE
ncbi:hypothetical protein MC378_06985 [Polaribacter sp. MSW13]|uniref:Uncharacterized protein n=1 Tax=Polaribacter marinus TaxID=2916838 RepID=A0A9X1VPS8_9FLAO|nr:hypothetical protein [Polaribacter marinus]MCI2228907.1 hypothetical protein [Polaribacter marinus]